MDHLAREAPGWQAELRKTDGQEDVAACARVAHEASPMAAPPGTLTPQAAAG